MPVMGGLEAAQQIWQEFGEDKMKIVVISASSLAHQQEKYLSEGFDSFISKPFRAQQIYDCLADLLHVEYQYGDDAASSIDFKEISLPEELLSRLREAAELYRTIQFEDLLDNVRQIGSEAARLAEHLHQLSRDLEIDAILEILGDVESE